METLAVLMPTREGRFIPQEVLEGLVSQRLPFRLLVSTAVSDGDYAAARNHIKHYAASGPYVLMLDNDVVLPDNALHLMVQFLRHHEDFAAIALAKYTYARSEPVMPLDAEEPGHVDMSCVLFRTDALLALTFGYPGQDPGNRQGCECLKACQDIRDKGQRIGFLKGVAAKHIYDTETGFGAGRQTRP